MRRGSGLAHSSTLSLSLPMGNANDVRGGPSRLNEQHASQASPTRPRNFFARRISVRYVDDDAPSPTETKTLKVNNHCAPHWTVPSEERAESEAELEYR